MPALNRPSSTVEPVDHALPKKTRALFVPEPSGARAATDAEPGPDVDPPRAPAANLLRATGPTSVLDRGDVIDRYVVLTLLGQGAMGVVYAAYDPELDRKVALKLLSPQAEGGLGSAGRTLLLREAQALARLAHPNVVAIHDVGTHGEQVWIAMEFVAGQTLDAWASERPRRWPDVLKILTDVSHGVAAAHAVGLVHRDLKPDNVMVDSTGRVRVMDFGLAHGRAAEVPETCATLESDAFRRPEASALSLVLTQSGAVNGTPAYMAPEQWSGDEASVATDQFGWSVMAWELLFGERPFAGTTMSELGAAVVAGRRRPPPRGRAAPGWLRRMIERGLAGDPSRRWPSMAALIAALERGQTRARRRMVTALLVGTAMAGAVLGGVRQWNAPCASTHS